MSDPITAENTRERLLTLLLMIRSGPHRESIYTPQLDRHYIDGLVQELEAIPGELNPEHPMTQWSRDQWHKLLAVTMSKHGLFHVMISESDIIAFGKKFGNIAVKDGEDGDNCIHLYLISNEEAQRLAESEARKAGT